MNLSSNCACSSLNTIHRKNAVYNKHISVNQQIDQYNLPCYISGGKKREKKIAYRFNDRHVYSRDPYVISCNLCFGKLFSFAADGIVHYTCVENHVSDFKL
ncbi:hypothetical protein PUN28_000983 [Cardiocondyla obscurior]|uniref:Uncharacterized protein n=1 Tax=Cardiocondyla obscurior TaxID=286306 RepID=A0AAW2H2J7_9HYME